jgi:hypothetical protein
MAMISASRSSVTCRRCILSIGCAGISLLTFWAYGAFHTIALHARHFGEDPGFVTCSLVDWMKNANVVFAVLALILAIHRHHTGRGFRMVALALTIVACMTAPIVT